jgi:hypothetical protein
MNSRTKDLFDALIAATVTIVLIPVAAVLLTMLVVIAQN